MQTKLFRDKNNNVVLFQKPNLPIIVWLVCLTGGKFTNGDLQTFFELVGFGAIFTWSWLEIFQGVNYFRRILGLIVMLITIFSRIN
jgi:hypothetical protein